MITHNERAAIIEEIRKLATEKGLDVFFFNRRPYTDLTTLDSGLLDPELKNILEFLKSN